jgi:hypothetical protein
MGFPVVRQGHVHGHFFSVGPDVLLIESRSVGALAVHARPALRRHAAELRFCDIELPGPIDGIGRERGGAKKQGAEQCDCEDLHHSPSPLDVVLLLVGQRARLVRARSSERNIANHPIASPRISLPSFDAPRR